MDLLTLRQWFITLAHAFSGWAICTVIMGVGMAVTTLPTAMIFISFIILMDVFIVALLIQKSFAMFKSVLGTYFTGRIIKKR